MLHIYCMYVAYMLQADAWRLQKLEEFGGIYMDWDVITIRPFNDLLKYPAALESPPPKKKITVVSASPFQLRRLGSVGCQKTLSSAHVHMPKQ